jgi:hypothetical protein
VNREHGRLLILNPAFFLRDLKAETHGLGPKLNFFSLSFLYKILFSSLLTVESGFENPTKLSPMAPSFAPLYISQQALPTPLIRSFVLASFLIVWFANSKLVFQSDQSSNSISGAFFFPAPVLIYRLNEG